MITDLIFDKFGFKQYCNDRSADNDVDKYRTNVEIVLS